MVNAWSLGAGLLNEFERKEQIEEGDQKAHYCPYEFQTGLFGKITVSEDTLQETHLVI